MIQDKYYLTDCSGSGYKTALSSGAEIAQSVEQRTENPCVPGSNPGLGTIIIHWRGCRTHCDSFFYLLVIIDGLVKSQFFRSVSILGLCPKMLNVARKRLFTSLSTLI